MNNTNPKMSGQLLLDVLSIFIIYLTVKHNNYYSCFDYNKNKVFIPL